MMKGKPVTVMDYRTRDGLADFAFSIEFQSDSGWRVYIIFDPFRRSHDHHLDIPYQSIDHTGRRYVDWSSKINTLGEAKTVAGVWAELAQRDQRIQQERALYLELIERGRDAKKKKEVITASPTRPDTPVDAGEESLGDQHHASTTPHASAPAQVLSSPQRQCSVA
jgi:hypothetical protein